jgi:hypothetical protein
MHWLKLLIIPLALLQGGWLAFDGGRALIVGDYVTASSGPRAGQLGPWSRVVSAFGFEPRSTSIKVLHLVLGIAWLASAVMFWLHPVEGRRAILMCSLASLWYLPIGTILSVIEIVLLAMLHRKTQ